MTHHLPWNEDTRMNLSDFLQKSMSFATTIMENQQAQTQASKHLGSLLKLQQQFQSGGGDDTSGETRQRQQDNGASVLNQLFATAEERMETDNDKRVVGLLKSQVATFIKTMLGVHAFDDDTGNKPGNEDQPSISWTDVCAQSEEHHTPLPTRHDDDDDESEDDGFAERAEKEHLDRLASEYNAYDKDDDEPDSEPEVEHKVLSRGIQSRGIQSRGMASGRVAADGFQTVQKKRYRRNQYRRQGGVACQEFKPTYLHSLPSDTYCIPIFFPSEDSYDMFHGALSMAQKTLHIAVFSLTDNKTANVLIDAFERGVDVRIVTDNDQLDGKGADVRRLHQDYGIPFKTDSSEQFMHNKFAIIDGRIVITGSFNWSIGARFKNMENVIITNIPSLATAYEKEFEKLWQDLHYE